MHICREQYFNKPQLKLIPASGHFDSIFTPASVRATTIASTLAPACLRALIVPLHHCGFALSFLIRSISRSLERLLLVRMSILADSCSLSSIILDPKSLIAAFSGSIWLTSAGKCSRNTSSIIAPLDPLSPCNLQKDNSEINNVPLVHNFNHKSK